MRREKSNEIAETAICPQEMVAHSGTLETLETLLTALPKGTFIIYNLELLVVTVSPVGNIISLNATCQQKINLKGFTKCNQLFIKNIHLRPGDLVEWRLSEYVRD